MCKHRQKIRRCLFLLFDFNYIRFPDIVKVIFFNKLFCFFEGFAVEGMFGVMGIAAEGYGTALFPCDFPEKLIGVVSFASYTVEIYFNRNIVFF